MSQRTLIEINHDRWHEIERRSEHAMRLLLYHVHGTAVKGHYEELADVFGIHVVHQRHHSEPSPLRQVRIPKCLEDRSSANPENKGHGHVVARPDGLRASCGGPRVCGTCALEFANSEAASAERRHPDHR